MIIFTISFLGDKPNKMILYKKNANATMGLLDPVMNGEHMIKTNENIVQTIDEILSSRKIEKVNMLKIDVEGYEYEVLLGCKESFRLNTIDKIICEIHLEYLKRKRIKKDLIYSLLRENGFTQVYRKNKEKSHILAIRANALA